MTDGVFIQLMLQKGREAGEKVKAELGDLSLAQLNWKAAADNWSIGQCLDHLIISDCLYFPALKKIAEGKYEMSFWENWSPLGGLFGKVLADQVQEKPRRKMKAPKVLLPSESSIDAGIMERFHKHLDTLLEYTAHCSRIDIDRVHITSPVSKIVTYSLRRAITLLIQHEHRHINQAIRVRSSKEFPVL